MRCMSKRVCLYAPFYRGLHGCRSLIIYSNHHHHRIIIIYRTLICMLSALRGPCPSRVLARLRRDNYEITKGIAPGTIVKNWVSETAAIIKTLDKNHMARALPGSCYLRQPYAGGSQWDMLGLQASKLAHTSSARFC